MTMQRVARIYVGGGDDVTPGIRNLLDVNSIRYSSIDVSGDTAARRLVLEKAHTADLPVIELDGMFAGGKSIVHLARALGLRLTRFGAEPCAACC